MVTSLGDLVVELAEDRAPVAVSAFLAQVDKGVFDGGSFARIVNSDNDNGTPTIQVVQGFCRTGVAHSADVPAEMTDATGLLHEDGVISLPRVDGGASSAQSFFLCLGAQPALDAGGGRTDDGLGFSAFGRLVAGADVLRTIHSSETIEDAPDPFLRGQVAAEPVPIYRIGRERMSPAERLEQLAQDYWRFRVWEFPTEATAAGITTENRRLEGNGEADYARRARVAQRLLARAREIDGGALDDAAKITLSLLVGQLSSIIDAYQLCEHRRPQLYPFSVADAPDQLAQTTALDTFAQREDFAARLQAAPAFIEQGMALLCAGFAEGRRVPRILVPRILAILDSHLSAEDGLAARITRRLEPGVPGVDEEQLAQQRQQITSILSNEVLPAIAGFRGCIAMLGPEELTESVGLLHEPEGRAYYRYKVRQQTSLDLDPEAVHAMGLAEVARVQVELDIVLAAMGRPGERAAVAAELEARIAPDAASLLKQVRALAKQIDGLLPRLFGRLPRITYAVEQFTADASAALPPALAQPAPADRATAGVYWLTALPERCPEHLHVPLTLHEAWPGHLMQFALAQEQESLPAFRRHGWSEYNGYVEGWALYCERLGEELGLYRDPADRFGLLSFELWRAARLVVDTGLHWNGWGRDQAIEYMVENTFLPRGTIEAEVDRYIGMPAQALSYKLGERTITALRAEAEAALGDRFALRDFHDELLALGPVSLDALQGHMRRWIEAK
ncbi:MAG TPA: DUF885 family protein [Phenylobacterium sp.]|uniref:DUF885 family protein n=1 Tax=Phenylobacterium sp. TaxID=1871053 RepID=UPI002B45D69B|nr:DUF885 family protein [Phenylobacterium sp.]HKR87714.1 DUF885 family protein [Phenylobacterium sp.]